jgi:2'-5' RNA ligase
VDIDGAGVFDGPQPVVFLPVVKGPALVDAHARIMEATQDRWERVWPHYLPDAWCPHVTLALRDLAPEHLAGVLADLRGRMTRLTTRLDSLDLVHVVLPQHRYLRRWALDAHLGQQRGKHRT